MNILKLKYIGFGIFTLSIVLLSIIAILGIWEVLEQDTAWKATFSLGIVAFSSLFITVVWEKLFIKFSNTWKK